MTFATAARCSDGVCVVTDTKIWYKGSEKVEFESKISGDIGHIIMAYAGGVASYKVFRELFGSKVQAGFSMGDGWSSENLIERSSALVRLVNDAARNPVEILMVYQVPESENDFHIYYIQPDGKWQEVKSIAIGSGRYEAENNLFRVNTEALTMREFSVLAVSEIMRLQREHPELQVGLGKLEPSISWFREGELWDEAPSRQEMEKIMKEGTETLGQQARKL